MPCCRCPGNVPNSSCTCGLHKKWQPEEPKVKIGTEEQPLPRRELGQQKSCNSSEAENLSKCKTSPKTGKPKPVSENRVVTREDDIHQKQPAPGAPASPVLSLHRKDVENKGMTHKKHTQLVQERRRSSWEFFLESKKLRKLKEKKKKKESEIKKKHDWMKKTTEKRIGRKSVRRFFSGLKNTFGLGNKKREKKKVKQNRDIYPLDEFSTRSSTPFRMHVQ